MQNTDILILDVHDKDKFIIIYGNLYICKFSDFARRKIWKEFLILLWWEVGFSNPFRQRIVALIVQYTKFILTFVYITEFFLAFPPQTFTGQRKCVSFKLFKRYIDCFWSICKWWRNSWKIYCGVGNGPREVPIFPQG